MNKCHYCGSEYKPYTLNNYLHACLQCIANIEDEIEDEINELKNENRE